MTRPTPRRLIEPDLDAKLDAASARARTLTKCSRAIRATVGSQYGATFVPRCARCHRSGRLHNSPLTSEQHYICATCGARWSVQQSVT
jgi:transposase-like protein